MSRQPELCQWIDTVVMRFPPLSKPQALGLALWSFGMIFARSCSLAAVADLLASLSGQSFNTTRERGCVILTVRPMRNRENSAPNLMLLSVWGHG